MPRPAPAFSGHSRRLETHRAALNSYFGACPRTMRSYSWNGRRSRTGRLRYGAYKHHAPGIGSSLAPPHTDQPETSIFSLGRPVTSGLSQRAAFAWTDEMARRCVDTALGASTGRALKLLDSVTAGRLHEDPGVQGAISGARLALNAQAP
ncbi:hypothetical protein HYPSUDRAFT_203638 [Hypholoma sublateritium FD-334 SS-4]|uniref:Uncharacterized protein n=1 Tax=Hypholoma sublateritium (strain FD-334 SS-4) TaxID=945553 RepID=A0A0D2L203_HYPSF|nr:hypothetical protein HYPSUDRAFT_203638 [Hypholoma sublateritium FD-334 SS-4]